MTVFSASPTPRGDARVRLPAADAPRPVEADKTDLTAPTDPIMADSAAALSVIRAGFAAAHVAVTEEAARFAADIERLVAGAEGWETVLELARKATP